MKNFNLEILKANVLITSGTDKICLFVKLPTAFPAMEYETTLYMDTQKGFGEDYCKNVFGIEPEVIKTYS